jgi:hypothetical protein
VWSIPFLLADRDENKAFAIQAECLKSISFYHSRMKNALFLATAVRPSFITSKAAAMAIYQHITGDILPR